MTGTYGEFTQADQTEKIVNLETRNQWISIFSNNKVEETTIRNNSPGKQQRRMKSKSK